MAVEGKFYLLQLAEHCGYVAKPPAVGLHNLLTDMPHLWDSCFPVAPDAIHDGAVCRLTDDCLIVRGADFFAPMTSQPEPFGRMATAKATNNVCAIGPPLDGSAKETGRGRAACAPDHPMTRCIQEYRNE